MSPILTWLHLSDLHACKPKTGWDAKRVTDALCKDLKKMQKQQGLRPDLIFFTGDAAYGQIGDGGGKSLSEQFRDAHDFLTAVRESFEPQIEQRNLFLVPGNHDVNRRKIAESETIFLDSIKSLDKNESDRYSIRSLSALLFLTTRSMFDDKIDLLEPSINLFTACCS